MWCAARICSGRPACTGCYSICSTFPHRSTGITGSSSMRPGKSSRNRPRRPVCGSFARKARRRPTSAVWLACYNGRRDSDAPGMRCCPWVGLTGTMAVRSRARRTTRLPKRPHKQKKRAARAAPKARRKRSPAKRSPAKRSPAKSGSGMVEAALAAFAHEVRTPLTGILAISNLLATSDLDERERRWVDTIKAGAEHLASLATLFVDAARSGRSGLGVRQDFFDLRALARSIGDSLSGRAAAKGLQSSVEIAEKLPAFVIGDPV